MEYGTLSTRLSNGWIKMSILHKLKSDRFLDHYKALLVAQGIKEEYEVD